jgi:hypothetical protein
LELLTVLEDQETAQQQQQLGVSSSQAEGEQSGAGVPPTSSASARRQQLEDVLRLRFGYHLFEGGQCSLFFARAAGMDGR